MKEELIRVENGCFRREEELYRFEISISRGECIGVYVDDHFTSGTAYLDLFRGHTHLEGGKAFSCGRRVGALELERWITQNARIVNVHRFHSQELTVRDFLLALDRPVSWRKRRGAVQRLYSPEAQAVREQMCLKMKLDSRLAELSLLDYYRLSIFRVWFWSGELLILDRITEILRRRDVEKLMACVQLLLRQGTAVFLLDLDEAFLYRYCDRIDIVRDRRTCYRLYPEEYGEQLYAVLGWKPRDGGPEHPERHWGDQQVLRLEGLTFPDMAQQLGTGIGIQTERPDRPGGVLFENLTALDNLTTCLLPKAGYRLVHRRIAENILDEASRWFPREDLLRPLRTWPLPARLRFSYYKWYLLNPQLLICFFPFSGQETAYHEMIIDLLVACAERGMAVWVISSGIDGICEKTENREFLKRLRTIN